MVWLLLFVLLIFRPRFFFSSWFKFNYVLSAAVEFFRFLRFIPRGCADHLLCFAATAWRRAVAKREPLLPLASLSDETRTGGTVGFLLCCCWSSGSRGFPVVFIS